MQIQMAQSTTPANDSFCLMLARAQNGDNQSLEKILELLQPDIDYLACFIKMPREESIQEIKTTFIELLRSGKISIF